MKTLARRSTPRRHAGRNVGVRRSARRPVVDGGGGRAPAIVQSGEKWAKWALSTHEIELFLGFGTGLGTAMVIDGSLAPMEIAHLPYRKGRTYEDYVGRKGLKRIGVKKWRRHALGIVRVLRDALAPDDIVIGGGNASLLTRLPRPARRGNNDYAFIGGARLWVYRSTSSPKTRRPGGMSV